MGDEFTDGVLAFYDNASCDEENGPKAAEARSTGGAYGAT